MTVYTGPYDNPLDDQGYQSWVDEQDEARQDRGDDD